MVNDKAEEDYIKKAIASATLAIFIALFPAKMITLKRLELSLFCYTNTQ